MKINFLVAGVSINGVGGRVVELFVSRVDPWAAEFGRNLVGNWERWILFGGISVGVASGD